MFVRFKIRAQSDIWNRWRKISIVRNKDHCHTTACIQFNIARNYIQTVNTPNYTKQFVDKMTQTTQKCHSFFHHNWFCCRKSGIQLFFSPFVELVWPRIRLCRYTLPSIFLFLYFSVIQSKDTINRDFVSKTVSFPDFICFLVSFRLCFLSKFWTKMYERLVSWRVYGFVC